VKRFYILKRKEVISIKVRGRNRLKGVVKEVVLGEVMAKAALQLGDNRIFSAPEKLLKRC